MFKYRWSLLFFMKKYFVILFSLIILFIILVLVFNQYLYCPKGYSKTSFIGTIQNEGDAKNYFVTLFKPEYASTMNLSVIEGNVTTKSGKFVKGYWLDREGNMGIFLGKDGYRYSFSWCG